MTWRPRRRLSFTRDGRIVVFLSIGVGFAAINTGNNLLYLLLGWILSFIIASGVLSEQTLRGLVVERRPPPRIFANEPFLMEVSIANTKRRRASYSIEVEDLQGARPLDKRCYFLKIPEGKQQRTSYRHTFVRRGPYTLTGYRLATKFPFALFRKSRDVDAPLEVLVYPARVAVDRPPPRAANSGDALADRLGRRGEFHGLREHRAGDDRRDVHWKSSARTGRLLVREYEDELARRVVIGVDNALPDDVRDAVTANSVDERSEEHAPLSSGASRSEEHAPLSSGASRSEGLAPLSSGASRSEGLAQRGACGPWSQGFGAMTPALDAQVAALERAISTAASLAAAYLAAGWTVELVARGARVPPGMGKLHEAAIGKALALLPYVSDAVPFDPLPPRIESVLVQPKGVPAANRPSAQTVIDA